MEPRGPVTVSSVVLGTAEEPVLVRASHWAPPWWRFGHNDSYAVRTADGVVLIDSEPSGEEGERPVAIVLTTDQHERGAYELRERFGVPVWAPAGGDLEGRPDHLYGDGDVLPGALRAKRLLGAAHVINWQSPTTQTVWFTGDLLNGGSEPRHPLFAELDRRVHGLYAGASAEHVKRVGPEQFRRALRPLLEERIDLICGGHGLPVQRDPYAALQRLLGLDWEAQLAAGQDVGVVEPESR